MEARQVGTARDIKITPLDVDGQLLEVNASIAGEAIVYMDSDAPGLAADLAQAGDTITVEFGVADPVALYLASGGAAGHPPIPESYMMEWWPAAVRLPGVPQPLNRVKVYATAQGLYVYDQAPNTGDPNGTAPRFYSPINFEETPRPATGYAARQAGIKIKTAAGDVIIQPLGGCGCSNRTLDAWRPGWGSRTEAWEV